MSLPTTLHDVMHLAKEWVPLPLQYNIYDLAQFRAVNGTCHLNLCIVFGSAEVKSLRAVFN